MSLRSRAASVAEKITTGHAPEPHDYVSHGKPEGVAPVDQHIAASMARHARAQARRRLAPSIVTARPLALDAQPVEVIAAPIWQPRTISLPTDKVTQILGREPGRESVAVTNQSSAFTGTAATVFLFGTANEAEHFLNNRASILAGRRPFRGIALPDTGARTFAHTASVYAVAVSTGADVGIVDVSPAEQLDRRA